MKQLLIALIFIAAGCAGDDKKTVIDNGTDPVVGNGEILFKNNCDSCHKIDKDFTGPALRGSFERWPDKKSMYNFIRNPSQSENAYVIALRKKWAPAMMTSFKLSDSELDSIMNYCSKYDPVPVVVKVAE